MACGIYCIENIINNKKYIGQSLNISARLTEHKRKLTRKIHRNIHLQNAWNNYGENNFIFYILTICDLSLLDEKERDYISEYNTINPSFGYNNTSGGV